MTDLQFAALIGTIYIAPHVSKRFAMFVGGFILVAALVMEVLR